MSEMIDCAFCVDGRQASEMDEDGEIVYVKCGECDGVGEVDAAVPETPEMEAPPLADDEATAVADDDDDDEDEDEDDE